MEEENTSKRMRKLMMLLNEYEKDGDWYITYIIKGEKPERELQSSYMFDEDKNAIQNHIISKPFWFIKWLIDNDKINNFWQVIKDIDIWWSDTITWVDTYSNYEAALMLLAISDAPIDLLCERLK